MVKIHHSPSATSIGSLMLLLAQCLSFLCISHSNSIVDAFSMPSSSGDIKIVGLPGGQTQSLPGMYVQTFRRWIVQDDSNNNNNANGNSNTNEDCTSDDDNTNHNIESTNNNFNTLKIEPIQGAGLSNLPYNEGWVNPTTTSELWWPRDIPTLQTRPMLNVMFRSGILSYVSIGLDVRVPHRRLNNNNNNNDDKKDEKTEEEGIIISWRNYGMNSQPMARQWTTLDIAMERLFHVEGFIVNNNGNGGDEDYEELFPSMDIQSPMKKLATFIAEIDSLSPIAEGFHIVSFPMMDVWTDLPNPEDGTYNDDNQKGEKGSNAINRTDSEAIYKIVCMATSEPFVSKLLEMDEDLLTMSSTSVLEVVVSRSVKGGDSPYLPEPYKELYGVV